MLKKWLNKMLPSGRSSKKVESKTVIPAERHNIRAEMLSFAAENVIRRLKGAGFQAYVVGGAIRDLLLGIEPKDFDVATDATPEQVHKLFRRSRIIGRRFQIVHVMNGAEIIEVTTFRGGAKVHQNAHGRIMKDNTYGSIEEDAMRRDFTCNALYYDPEKEEILDFHNGIADVAARRLVMIGDAAERYQEDPVRILRAIRLSSKLGFDLSEETAAPIAESICRLKHEPVARLFDEIMKLLFSGHARECLKRLNGFDIPDDIHPLLNALRVSDGIAGKMTVLALKNTDERLRADKSVSVGFVLAALMWPELERHWKSNLQQGLKPVPALSDAINTMRETVERGWGVPQRFSATMREIWMFQPQFENRKGARPHKLFAQARFRAAYDFLLLRAETGNADRALAEWWTAFQTASTEQRSEMTKNEAAARHEKNEGQAKKRRRRRRKPKPKVVGTDWE
ncbi:polynucleotide adenylyltransferase PcnB [Neisseria meningitidis]|uniref:polynucleotide adenylyltransferase PcnB n=1 Tax=Neisseria meningitidis TaxID=487 RepID=UPI000C3439D9|nr:polynucleotide adenylyltransferase PcnB [Neisseria meningitidis]MCL6012227.1 polynucleotide adenylyltransferase PcnB [Neisseria meningitidis]MCL6125529.1 polynucleotide adenylyltransferase PcnB [Neisseria meningitidis]